MSERPASLLTKTQRRRIRNGFAEVEGAKRRRDQQQIRQRVAAGLDDARLLAEYPDRQFELALEDESEESVAESLGALYLLAERIRALEDVDEGAVTAAARERAAASDRERADVSGFETPTEGHRGETEVADRGAPSPWKRRADALLKVALLLLLPATGLAVFAPEMADGPAGGVPFLFGGVALVAGLGIVGVQAVKYDVVPALRRLTADPSGSLAGAWERF